MLKKFFISILFTLASSYPLQGMELTIQNNRSPEKQAELDELLCKAIRAQDLRAVKQLLQSGASANAKIHYFIDKHHSSTLNLSTAVWDPMLFRPHPKLCKLLLDYGADLQNKRYSPILEISTVIKDDDTLFTMYNLLFDYGVNIYDNDSELLQAVATSCENNNTLKYLIICPVFNPKLDIFAYKKIMTILYTLKQCGLPENLRLLILKDYLQYKDQLREIPSYGKLSTIKEEHAHKIPMKFVHELIDRGQLNPKATVAILKKNHIECIKPLMAKSLLKINKTPPLVCNIEKRKKILDPEMVEKNLGDAIEHNIRRRLGRLIWYKRVADILPTIAKTGTNTATSFSINNF